MYELTKYNINRPQQMFQLHRLRVEREKLYTIYKAILPEVKHTLIENVLSREADYNIASKDASMYLQPMKKLHFHAYDI
jgi:hypothetical protein